MKPPSAGQGLLPLVLRLRPPRAGSNSSEIWLDEITSTYVVRKGERYDFKQVLNQCSQEELYEASVAPQLEQFLSGEDACLFALGTTGSGKTYTVMGPASDPGIIRRVCHKLWSLEQDGGLAQDSESKFKLSMYELYNDRFYDLLNPNKQQLLLKSHSSGFSIDAQQFEPGSADEAQELVELGFKRRAVNATNCNEKSSRSHAFVQISTARARLVIADLAGSERLNEAGSTGVQRVEAGEINKSLMILGQCIQQLARGIIPARAAKLTRVLLANAHVVPPAIVVALDPYDSALTGAQILRYASLARQVRCDPAARAKAKQLAEEALEVQMMRKQDAAAHSLEGSAGSSASSSVYGSSAGTQSSMNEAAATSSAMRIEALLRRQIVEQLDAVFAQRIRDRIRTPRIRTL